MLAKAKLNLSLHVTGKRPDNYHTLQSLVMFANIGDTLSLTPANKFALEIDGAYADALRNEDASTNLVSRASHTLAKHAGIAPDVHIKLSKNIPIGAGLGGGSSDAASILHLLNKHWNLGYSHAKLAEIGGALGSDIPACVHAAPLWMEGAGERITPCDIAFDIPLLLVNPGIHTATKDIYARIQPPYDTPRILPEKFADKTLLFDYLRKTHNSLQNAAVALSPGIGALLAEMETLKGAEITRMSGSGSTCFALFSNQADCDAAASVLYSRHSNYWIQSTTLLGGHHG